jgi:hypothetical protein
MRCTMQMRTSSFLGYLTFVVFGNLGSMPVILRNHRVSNAEMRFASPSEMYQVSLPYIRCARVKPTP